MDIECHLALLRQQHRKLDYDVKSMHKAPVPDYLELQKLKRKKLRIKDEIHRLESLVTA
ncbi:hypothetical protein CO026_02990 [Candidatus Kaiserbacteria bacterium CG_4_9_14_0_2_um_filter_41_32]|uniref:DUF465 domain-containing protein n=1 Tax=Candidatus Kaiserbacteria bacterium CG_4_9_14_0_2_um_filter_41_32 TaxID=1974601 RepID=A0A2M8FE80_9BACT|nr:MAG: hypothetical protein CO026_02990 [Candidatus Kaiserbacteria bacterium CG_4_9_14_0_2_um_filter_41_32]